MLRGRFGDAVERKKPR